MKQVKTRNPWVWVPTLYMAEGLPNVIVTSVAVVLYMQMGLTDTEIGLYTGWLGLPWIIKPLWSPFVDLFKTKRWWVLTMQLLLGAAFAGVAFTVNTSFWFQGTMFFFFLMAFSSATHDIAADGFYMLDLDSHDQSWFVGIRNTFYRIAVIFGQGVLVWLAGVLQEIFPDSKAFTWSLIFFGLSAIFIAIWLYHRFAMPRPVDRKNDGLTASDVARGLWQMLTSFFTKVPVKQIVFVLLFLLLYRFPEAMLTKMASTFLLRPMEEGGLGLTGWHAGKPRRTETMAVALRLRHHTARYRICVSQFRAAGKLVPHQFMFVHRAVRLWAGIHRTDALHALLQPG